MTFFTTRASRPRFPGGLQVTTSASPGVDYDYPDYFVILSKNPSENRWDPEFKQHGVQYGCGLERDVIKPSLFRKLSRNWKIAVEYSVTALLLAAADHPEIGCWRDGIRWAIGFTDSPFLQGMCKRGPPAILYLNPLLFAGDAQQYRRGDDYAYSVHKYILLIAEHE